MASWCEWPTGVNGYFCIECILEKSGLKKAICVQKAMKIVKEAVGKREVEE